MAGRAAAQQLAEACVSNRAQEQVERQQQAGILSRATAEELEAASSEEHRATYEEHMIVYEEQLETDIERELQRRRGQHSLALNMVRAQHKRGRAELGGG